MTPLMERQKVLEELFNCIVWAENLVFMDCRSWLHNPEDRTVDVMFSGNL